MKQLSVYSLQFAVKTRNLAAYCCLILLLVASSCETPEKVLKSNDLNYKKNKAIYWYNKKEYFKCIPVLEELIGLMKGRESTEDLYYMYAMANYKQGDYMISAYHFKNFYDLYPSGQYAEECLHMQGKSFQMLSPKPDLDQTYTYKGLEAYQFYINMYPGGKFQYESNEAIEKLRKKLEKKALNAAELYYKTSNFKAAATSYEIILRDFPDIEESEKVSFMIVKARFKYAQNSIPLRKAERFNNVVKSYNDFKYKFGGSKYLEEAKEYEQQSHYLAVEGAFEWAETAAIVEREKYFGMAFNEAKLQLPYIIDQKEKDNINKWIEKGHFSIVKNNYQISEEKKSVEKLPSLLQTVKTYYIFVDQFPKSRYSKEAERIYNNSNALIKKLKTNG
ncbi:MAG: outer membrane protein assembly factor BamD [Bacteroidota bacterium]